MKYDITPRDKCVCGHNINRHMLGGRCYSFSRCGCLGFVDVRDKVKIIEKDVSVVKANKRNRNIIVLPEMYLTTIKLKPKVRKMKQPKKFWGRMSKTFISFCSPDVEKQLVKQVVKEINDYAKQNKTKRKRK